MKVVVVEGKIDVREEVKATAHLQWVLKKKKAEKTQNEAEKNTNSRGRKKKMREKGKKKVDSSDRDLRPERVCHSGGK